VSDAASLRLNLKNRVIGGERHASACSSIAWEAGALASLTPTFIDALPVARRLCSDGKPRGDDSVAFYELRQYFVRPGKMDEWVKIMEEEIIPFQVSKGMVICGSFRGETDDSAYFWLRRFNSEAEREAQYKAVYETDHWKTKIAPRVPDCLDREKMHIQRIVPTSRSTMQ